MLNTLHSLSPLEATIFFIVANIVIFAASILLCAWLGGHFKGKRIFPTWEPIRPLELAAALSSIGLNAGVSMIGWFLWKAEYISIYHGPLYHSLFHFVCMTLFMDFGMYVFHRAAHHPVLYKLMHSFHHRHTTTNPISLFVLHPIEVFGFGLLMITYLLLVPTDATGLGGVNFLVHNRFV